MYDEKNKSSILPLEKFFLFLFDIANGNFIFPLSIDEMSDTKAEVVADGPAPSHCIIFFQIGFPSTITAFKTPSTLAMYEDFLTIVGCTR